MNILDELKKLRSDPYIQSREGTIRADNALFLYNTLSHLKPKTFLEIGFNQGHGSITALKALSSDSKVVSLDIGVHKSAHHNSKIIKGDHDNFEIVFGDSTKILDSVCKKIKPLDFCIIDGGHSYAICKSDLDICMKYMSDDAIIWLDDYRRVATKPKEHVYVAPGVNQAGDEMSLVKIMNHYYYPRGGILVLSKRNMDFVSDIEKI